MEDRELRRCYPRSSIFDPRFFSMGVHCWQPGCPVAQGRIRYRCFLPDL